MLEPRIWDKFAGGDSWVPPQICKSETLLRPSNSWGLSCLALCPFGLCLLWSILGNVSFYGEISFWLVCNWLESTLWINSVHSCIWINKTLLKLVYKEFYMLFWIRHRPKAKSFRLLQHSIIDILNFSTLFFSTQTNGFFSNCFGCRCSKL